ncbi:mCG60365, isoform CRA_b [Mus musculus]|nr:mCG60365, isoform CRA_b [Mus musculus]EDL29797.1 mCG60365, isoform CRA_b [Mus musculus]
MLVVLLTAALLVLSSAQRQDEEITYEDSNSQLLEMGEQSQGYRHHFPKPPPGRNAPKTSQF